MGNAVFQLEIATFLGYISESVTNENKSEAIKNLLPNETNLISIERRRISHYEFDVAFRTGRFRVDRNIDDISGCHLEIWLTSKTYDIVFDVYQRRTICYNAKVEHVERPGAFIFITDVNFALAICSRCFSSPVGVDLHTEFPCLPCLFWVVTYIRLQLDT